VEDCEAHELRAPQHDHGRSGLMIVVGDTIHNFVDGLLIAAAFLESTQLGIVTALAIIAHEIPQEVGDFLILLHSGYSRARAFAINLLSSAATIVGGVLGYFALQVVAAWTQGLLGIVAASMIYIAVADLIPGLHKRPELKATLAQATLIALGIASVALVGLLVRHAD
jgi:zinc and cadmium transporter